MAVCKVLNFLYQLRQNQNSTHREPNLHSHPQRRLWWDPLYNVARKDSHNQVDKGGRR